MGIVFGLFVLVILTVALLNRRKARKTWVAEEHQEESGGWIDKRAGERGAYGSLDAEMEQERQSLSQQGRISDLARLIRTYAFEHIPGFHAGSDAQIRAFSAFARTRVTHLFATIEALKSGQVPEMPEITGGGNEHNQALKKLIMHFCYDQFPALFDLDIESIKHFDRLAESMAGGLLQQIAGFAK